jgi:hypothetical protein
MISLEIEPTKRKRWLQEGRDNARKWYEAKMKEKNI